MENRVKKGFYYLGIVAALYLFFYYILPLLFKILGIALKAVFFIFIWAAIGFVIVMLVIHVVKMVRNNAN